MAYNDTPLPTETPAASQPLMRQNFNQIGTSYNTDHIPLSSGANVGYSNKLTLVEQALDPSAVNLTGILYTKAVSEKQGALTYTRDEVHVRGYGFDNAAPGVPISVISQITNQALLKASGEGFMPGGLQIRCGAGLASVAGTTNTFSTAFPNGCVAVALAADNANNIVQVFTKAASNFSAKSAGGNCSLYYIAIGY